MTSPKELEASVIELARAVGLLIRRIRSEVPAEQFGLSWTQKSVMARLEQDGPATTAELARAEGVKPQSMSTALLGLEEIGLIERQAHPTDGRQVMIGLTAKGTMLRKSAREAKHTWLMQSISKLSKKEQAALFEAGELMKRLVDT